MTIKSISRDNGSILERVDDQGDGTFYRIMKTTSAAASGVTPATGSISGNGNPGTAGNPSLPPVPNRAVNLLLGTPGVSLGGATVTLVRQFPGDTNWYPCTIGGDVQQWTSGINEPVWEEPESGVILGLLTSGFVAPNIPYRVSQ